jgi:microcystin-dependent protein
VTTAKIVDANVTTAKIADANVTTTKLAALTQQALLPAGAIMPFARATAPSGWLIADGSVVPNGSGTVQGVTADFTTLYAAVGTNFGAAGTLPDLRGIFVRGSGSQTISGIAYTKTFAAKEGDAFQDHTHRANAGTGGAGASTNGAYGKGLDSLDPDSVMIKAASGIAGQRTATETRPANIALLYCIKI